MATPRLSFETVETDDLPCAIIDVEVGR